MHPTIGGCEALDKHSDIVLGRYGRKIRQGDGLHRLLVEVRKSTRYSPMIEEFWRMGTPTLFHLPHRLRYRSHLQ
jgi:hypothetical protein